MNRRFLFAALTLAAVAASPLSTLRATWADDHEMKPATTVARGGTICAVTGEEIADAKKPGGGKAVYNGKTYSFCCAGCAPKFKAEPAKYAKVTDLRLEKMTLAARLKAIDEQLTKLENRVGAKTATPAVIAEPAVKANEPVAKTTGLHCAITDEDIASAKDAAGSAVHNGKTYYFCCPGCVSKFKADPAKYAAEADKRDLARK